MTKRDLLVHLGFGFGYLIAVVAVLILPFDFSGARLRWLGLPNGAELASLGLRTPGPAERLYEDLVTGTGLTVEIWAASAKPIQSTDARILSYSGGYGPRRNFTVFQDGPHLRMMVRTRDRKTGHSVMEALEVRSALGDTEAKHIVLTLDGSTQRAYIDGTQRESRTVNGGDFSNWNDDYLLLIGNEASGDRPWFGNLYLVALYDRALSQQEIETNYAAGRMIREANSNGRSTEGIAALYLFSNGQGSTVPDRSGRSPAVDVEEPTFLDPRRLVAELRLTPMPGRTFELVGNVVIFVPLGFLFRRALSFDSRGLRTGLFVVSVAAFISLGAEYLQFFSAVRVSSLLDVINNTLGSIVGVLLANLKPFRAKVFRRT